MMVDANDTALLQAVRQNQKFVSNLWEDKHNIRYCFGSSLTNVAQQAMVEAIQHFKNNIPCIGFKQVAVGNDTTKKCAEEPAIYIGSFSSGCFAHVGQPYKISSNPDAYTDSQLNLGNGCETMGVAAHELGHNLGMLHEQSRTDHGQYVKILWDNIREDKRHNYDTSEDGDRTMPYDMLSLMHYSDTAFGIVDADGTKLKTMEAVNSPNGSTVVMGNRMGLTHQDARQVGSMYGCLEEIDHFKLCTPDPEGCTMEDCGCHQEASALDEIIKTTDAQGCNRCLKMCPMHPYGTSGACGCPEGLEQ
ncbi:MEP1B, partial [Symbiodinium sp. CCMP2456]